MKKSPQKLKEQEVLMMKNKIRKQTGKQRRRRNNKEETC